MSKRVLLFTGTQYGIKFFDILRHSDYVGTVVLVLDFDQFNAATLRELSHRYPSIVSYDEFLQGMEDENPEAYHIGFSVHFTKVFPKSVFSFPSNGIVNLHPAFLPFGRGSWPETWTIFHNYRAGVTLHQVIDGIDEGPILHQFEVPRLPFETAGQLATRLEREGIKFFEERLDSMLAGLQEADQQPCEHETFKHIDFARLQELNLDQPVTIGAALTQMLATTLPEWNVLPWFKHNGKKYNVSIKVEEVSSTK